VLRLAAALLAIGAAAAVAYAALLSTIKFLD
jgi:hypothetical protein